MSKEKFIFDLKMSMQLFWFNDELYLNRDVNGLEEKANFIYDDLCKIVNIDLVEFVTASKNTCEVIHSDYNLNKYQILFNIHLHFADENIVVQKCLVCDCIDCIKI